MIAVAMAITASAQSYVVIDRETNVYDQPNSKQYVTTNMNGDEIKLVRGMAFKKVESATGFDKIEYTPGINGFVLSSVEVTPSALKAPQPGTYPIANAAGKNVTVEKTGTDWSATLDGKKYSGIDQGNIILFYGADSNPIVSLVNLSGTPVAITYDNTYTHFL
jgi:hypothetical protein